MTEVVDMVVEGLTNAENGYGGEGGIVREAAGYFETVVPNALEEL